MKVWVVLRHMPYEGSDIVAVYSTEQAADTERSNLERDNPRSVYDYTVDEWEVQ